MNEGYFHTDSATLLNPTVDEVSQMYEQGYVFTRLAKYHMNQTRSLRVNLDKFELTSENKRVLRKNEDILLSVKQLPLKNYSWEIHKLGKDFYTKKFGEKTISASKIKEMFNDKEKSNMNIAFYFGQTTKNLLNTQAQTVGYCLAYENLDILHYAYPFYDLTIAKEKSLGIAMMTKAILWAKENNKKYIYLGSVNTPESRYKLQFEGLEWFDTNRKAWSTDLDALKGLIAVSSKL